MHNLKVLTFTNGNFILEKVKFFDRGIFFLKAFSFRRKVATSLKIVINFSRNYENLNCKGKPFGSAVGEMKHTQTDKDPSTFI